MTTTSETTMTLQQALQPQRRRQPLKQQWQYNNPCNYFSVDINYYNRNEIDDDNHHHQPQQRHNHLQ